MACVLEVLLKKAHHRRLSLRGMLQVGPVVPVASRHVRSVEEVKVRQGATMVGVSSGMRKCFSLLAPSHRIDVRSGRSQVFGLEGYV
jgi:hypothetical protein